jgi:CcmD family protein
MLIRVVTLSLTLALVVPIMVRAQPPQAPQSEFVPADSLPPGDQLPAAPLLVAAYAFVWIAALFYVWTIWKRLNKVESEMRALERRSRAS